MQMALLGYGVNLDIKHVPICVFDREGSQQSEALLKAFQASPYFDIIETERDYDCVKRAIDAGRCRMAIVIPPDFSQDLAATNSAQVQAILDATDDNTANIALRLCRSGRRTFSSNVQLQRLQSLGEPPPNAASRGAIPSVVQRGSRKPQLRYSRHRRDCSFAGRRSADLADNLARVGARYDGGAGVDAGHPHGADDGQDPALFLYRHARCGSLPRDRGLLVRGAVPRRGLTLFVTTSLFLIVVLGLGYFISASIRSQIGASQIALAGHASCRRRCYPASPFRSTRCRRPFRRSPILSIRATT